MAALLILTVIYLFLYFVGLPIWLTPSTFYVINIVIYILINVWYLWKYKRDNIFSFELLFSISFGICCFLLLVLLEQLNPSIPTHSLMLNFSDHMLCRSCSLSMLGYLFYMIALVPVKSREKPQINVQIQQSPKVSKMLNYLTLLLIVMFFVLGGGNFIYSYDQTVEIEALNGERFGRFGAVMTYIIILLNVSTVSNIITKTSEPDESILHFIKKIDFLFLINVLIMSGIFLLGGYRSGAMQILLPFLAMLSYKRVLKTKQTFYVIVSGIVVMALIGQLRSNTSTLSDVGAEMTLLNFFRDFISANAATPSLVEYVDFNGNADFRNAYAQILSVIPFLQSLVLGILGSDLLMPSSSHIYTYDICNSFNSGKGTNIIGDLYYTDGSWCVFAMMFLLGWIIRKTTIAKNKYVLLILVCLIGNAVFMPRVEFFYIARTCGLAIIIYWLVSSIFPFRRLR